MAGLVMLQVSVAAMRAATAADLAALAGADSLRGLGPPGPVSPAMFPATLVGSAGNSAGSTAAAGPDSGPGSACSVAREVAARNAAVISHCEADPGDGILSVETEVEVPALPVRATGRARAGPPG